MANVKNFSLEGIASLVEFGKKGLKLVSNTSGEYISFTSNDGNTSVEVRGANAAVNEAFMTKAQLDSITTGIVQFVSTDVSYNSGNVTLFETPANSMIYNVVVDVDTAWTGADDTTGISVGDDSDSDRLFTDNHVDLSEAFQYQSEYQHVYANATSITAFVTQGSASAGSARVTVSVVMDEITVKPISLPESPSYINQGLLSTGSEPSIDSVTAPSSVDEGSTANIAVSTSNIPNNTTLSWSLTRSDDFTVSTGSFVVTGDTGSFSVSPTEDNTTEGAENFYINITGAVDGIGVSATSNVITINDTSTSAIEPGQQAFTTVGTFTFTVPDNVTTISAVAVGGGKGGQGGAGVNRAGDGGKGGSLSYGTFTVTPGEELEIVVGEGGAGGLGANNGSTTGGSGGVSTIKRGSTILLGASSGGTAVTSTGTGYQGGGSGGSGGGNFGDTGGGGGGAGGYSGNGGNGSSSTSQNSTSGSGGGGGGGNTQNDGGGVGILGEGSSGAAGGNPGSGGVGKLYGGGGGGASYSRNLPGRPGGQGAVRIIWGTGRSYPSTNTADA